MKAIFTTAMAASAALAAWSAQGAPSVLPSGDSVPENLLRIELVLDRPLQGTLDMARVSLADGQGHPIANAFLDIPLTSRDGRRIAILMHPGRIKSGVGPNRQVGLALHGGQQVTLTIADPQLPATVKKVWHVRPALHQRIDTQAWQLMLPRPGSRAPLQVRFPAALGATARDLIAVSAPDGRRLQGTAALSQGERQWSFQPTKAWRAGPYELRVHASLEDPEGNRMCSAFEQVAQSAVACNEHARIPFEMAGAAARRDTRKALAAR